MIYIGLRLPSQEVNENRGAGGVCIVGARHGVRSLIDPTHMKVLLDRGSIYVFYTPTGRTSILKKKRSQTTHT